MRLAVMLTALFVGAGPLRAEATKDTRKKLVLLIAGQSYETERTLPEFAARFLAADFRVVTVTGAMGNSQHRFDHLEEIADAAVLLVSVWRRSPPKEQLALIRRYVESGRPVVGIATSSHAFARRKGAPLGAGQADWPEWGATVMGGNYTGHRPIGLITTVTAVDPIHPLLKGVTLPFRSKMELNQVSPIDPKTHAILSGSLAGFPAEPAAWTFTHIGHGRTFFTPLGHPEDFENPSFQRLLLNGIRWAAGL
jgi:type 1 glutamine amidotransferase